MQRTLTIPLDLTQEQKELIKQTQLVYKAHFDEYAAWFKTNKTSSKVRSHTALYSSLRAANPHFPSALHQAARDHASEAIKSYNSRNWKKRWSTFLLEMRRT